MSHYVNVSFFKYTELVECNKARHYEGVIIVFAIWKIQNITWHPHRQYTRFKRTYTVVIHEHILQGWKFGSDQRLQQFYLEHKLLPVKIRYYV